MRELLIKNGFVHYATGCSCQGLPKYYKHQDYPDYRIITKGGFGIIRKSGVETYRTKDAGELLLKIKELTK